MPRADREAQQHEVPRLQHGFHVVRRDFFKLMGGGVLVCVAAGRAFGQESAARSGQRHEMPSTLDSWLHIGENGRVTAFTGKVEVGQNVRTSLAQQVAEELRVPLESVSMIMGDTSLTPFDMGTFGSRTTPQMGSQLRKAAASARAVLTQLAAERWQIDGASLVAENSGIREPKSRRSLTYVDLTHGQKLMKVIPADPPLTRAVDWKIAGAGIPKRGGRAFVTGAHKYSSDMAHPGMVHGKMVRPAAYHAKLTSCDTSLAEKMPGVTVVRDGDFIGVTAADVGAAQRAAGAIQAKWDAPQQVSESGLFEHLKASEQKGSEDNDRIVQGSVEQARSVELTSIQQTYTVAYIAHVPLEPRAAVAEWSDGKLTVWTGTQRPFAVRDELTNAFHISQDNVRVIVPDTGSAYGGKHSGEVAVEAARLAKAAGKVVRLVWTREEEFTWAYFRPAGVIEVKSSAKPDGTLVSWEFDNYNSGPAGMGTPYEVPNQRIEFHPSDSPLRQGSYRGLAATANFFARESHMDELAHGLKIDPLDFRLQNLKDERLRAVFQEAAERFGWGKKQPEKNRGFGIAGGIEKNGHVATCAEVAIEHGQVNIVRVVEAFDCGAVINPQGLRNQISGAIVQGLGGALFESIHFENGQIQNAHLSGYRVPRFSDLPQIDVVIVNRKDQPSMGAGETPLIGIAAAVANAIFGATGVRLRSLPLAPRGMPASS
ncbi:MAG TPA: molybdopterin cofactor-binding domain-containing protein [Terriglobales bacterium]|jgi:isoquinoline 1-oxidoreductase|nr:molybdopterin cofactor-binding domain-containing protein [Terriglobales bacterium]